MSSAPPGGQPNYGSAIRMAQIIHWLHGAPHGLALSELGTRLGVSPRTLARYIRTLKDSFDDESGEPLVEIVRGGSEGRLRFRRKVVEMEGTAYELMSLYMGLDLMAFLDGTFLMDGAQDALDRLQDRLRQDHGNQIALVLKDFHKKFFHWTEAPKDYSAHNQTLDTLVDALVKQKQVKLVYQSPNRDPREHLVQPLTLLMYKRALYLIARRERDGETHEITFAVERIKSAQATDETFAYPQNYDPQARFRGTFGLVSGDNTQEVRLVFAARVAQNVASRRWHISQKHEFNEDGSLLMSLELDPGEEFLAWLLGYGHYVVVLGPESLQQRIRERLSTALEAYTPSKA